MNGTEQRTHTTAVRSIGRRLDDIETLVMAMGRDLLKERALRQALGDEYRILQSRVDDIVSDRAQRDAQWDARTFWQRLHFVFWGA